VRRGDIHLGQPGIMAHHLQTVVAEKVLKGEYVAPISKVGNREGVAKFMRVRLYPKPLSQASNQQPQAIPAIWLLLIIQEQRRLRVVSIRPVFEIFP
jgi:hypothetical protein